MPRPKLKETKIQTSITISARDANLLKAIGGENLSEGIATLIRSYLGTKAGREIEMRLKEEALSKLDPLFR